MDWKRILLTPGSESCLLLVSYGNRGINKNACVICPCISGAARGWVAQAGAAGSACAGRFPWPNLLLLPPAPSSLWGGQGGLGAGHVLLHGPRQLCCEQRVAVSLPMKCVLKIWELVFGCNPWQDGLCRALLPPPAVLLTHPSCLGFAQRRRLEFFASHLRIWPCLWSRRLNCIRLSFKCSTCL